MKEYIEKIVANGKQEDMDCLSDILVDSLYKIKEFDYNDFKKYKIKIKGMAYNYQIDDELAQEIVRDMKPLGEYWDMQTIQSVIGNDNHRLCDMYVVMNSLANDYQSIISLDDAETYVKMARAWLDDIDGKTNKVWWYFVK
jgi:hypothetical protein